MTTTYRLNVNELSTEIIQSIKEAFKGKHIEISVSETEQDETDRLLASPGMRRKLDKAIEQVNEGKVTTMNIEELRKRYQQS